MWSGPSLINEVDSRVPEYVQVSCSSANPSGERRFDAALTATNFGALFLVKTS